jgi:hypothetical protein
VLSNGGFDGFSFRGMEFGAKGGRVLNRDRHDKLVGRVWSWATLPSRALVLATFIVTSVGCGNILGIEDIEPCWNASGFDGRGCWRTGGGCKLTKEQLPNACTDAACVPFDNQERLGLSSAADLPKIPMGPPGNINGPAAGGSDDCPQTDRVIVTGSNAIVPVVSYIGAELASAQTPVTVLYQSQSSCIGAAAIFKDVEVAGEFQYWVREGNKVTEKTCNLPKQLADIGTSDVFGATCGFEEDSAVAEDAQGPIQAMIFVAPRGSAERAISAEAARLVYGYGGKFDNDKFVADPWTNLDNIHRRNPTSGTQNLIGEFIGVPSAKFVGYENGSTTDMIASMQKSSPNVDGTIGLLDVVNWNPEMVRIGVRQLAYQAEGQNCAFLPNLTEDSRDKRNVRDGHYTLWGPIHIYSRPFPPTNVGNVVKYLSIQSAPTNAGRTAEESMSELIQIVAAGHLVPTCAMRVKRTSDGGPLLPLDPTQSCSCFFDERTSSGPTCTRCTKDTDCVSADAPYCSFGFCERQ